MMDHVSNVSFRKTRYAICGLSVRGVYHFMLPLLGKSNGGAEDDFSQMAEVVGILDLDHERVREFLGRFGLDIPWYSPDDGVERMISETRPDVLLVAGPDYTHCDHIVAGLNHGLKVVCEKPAVTNCEEMKRVLAAEAVSAGRLIVAHNYRYADTSRRIKELLRSGCVGRVTNVELVYNLDTFHGASYFHRWNRQREKSGGLSVHKSVHHLDLINWMLETTPETVFAFGALNYYGPVGAHRPRGGDGAVLDHIQTREGCPYFKQHYASKGQPASQALTSTWDPLQLPYDGQYPQDRYIYDEEINIEDTYSVVVKYRNGASLSYSCNFSTPWEGYVLAINGTEGRLEASHHSNPDPTGLTPTPPEQDRIVVMPLFGGRQEHVVPLSVGGHGGADPLIRRDLFVTPSEESLRLGLPSDSYAGAVAIAAGEAIWRSAKEGRPYTVAELLGDFYRTECLSE